MAQSNVCLRDASPWRESVAYSPRHLSAVRAHLGTFGEASPVAPVRCRTSLGVALCVAVPAGFWTLVAIAVASWA